MPKKPFDESERLESLHALDILDTPPEASYDELVQLAAKLCNAPIALVSLVDESRQWFKAETGTDLSETPREIAFCDHCIRQASGGAMVIPNALEDERFKTNPLVTDDPFVRFYAGVPIYSREQQPIGTLCIIDNKPRQLTSEQLKALTTLAKQVSTQLQLRRSNQLLAEQNESLNQLFRIISHDLRAPFQGFLGVIELLEGHEGRLDKEEIRDFLTSLKESATETHAMLVNLLEWSTLEADSLNFSLQRFNLLDIVEQAFRILGTPARNKRISLVHNMTEAAPVKADPKMLGSVIRNLLGNAIKFTPEDGRIELSAVPAGDALEISVSDNGAGLSPSQVEKLLQKQRIESAAGTQGEAGTGIGFYLIHRFLEHHGTQLHIASNISGGARFSFFLTPASSLPDDP
ncbi:MAG: ATP-binding protein [Opitutales bacterium]